MNDYVNDLLCALGGLVLLGIGLALHDVGTSLAVVGGVVFVTSVLAQLRKRTPPA